MYRRHLTVSLREMFTLSRIIKRMRLINIRLNTIYTDVDYEEFWRRKKLTARSYIL